ncbi:MAG: TetR/AcrR family transcriptional regulator C-terminal domain-containing protein [Treponema sp.]|nr:TetR/AcrR family transcriptional regulator C-terminal domain-containing protein [Treponema sp.]
MYKSGLSHLILDAFNNLFITSSEIHTDEERYQMYWYSGATYNSLMLWIAEGMSKSPEIMNEIFTPLIPDDCGELLLQ